jgi:hypothetical protein
MSAMGFDAQVAAQWLLLLYCRRCLGPFNTPVIVALCRACVAAPRIGLSYQFAIAEVVSAVRWLCPDQMWKVRFDQ